MGLPLTSAGRQSLGYDQDGAFTPRGTRGTLVTFPSAYIDWHRPEWGFDHFKLYGTIRLMYIHGVNSAP